MHIGSLCSHTAARNLGICRATALHLFQPTAPHTQAVVWSPILPEHGGPDRKRESCKQLQPKGTGLWAHICCTIHEAGACLAAGSSQ